MSFSPSIDYSGIFGDGSTGTTTWTSASPVTLSADVEYENLTIESGDHFTAGFMLRVRNTLTLKGGRLLDEGNDGTDGQTVSSDTDLTTKSSGGAGDVGAGWLRRVKYAGGSGGSARTIVNSDSNGLQGDGSVSDGNYSPSYEAAFYGGGAGGNSGYGGSSYGQGGASNAPDTSIATVNKLFLAAIAKQRNTQDTEYFCDIGGGAGGGGGGGFPKNVPGLTKGSGGGGGSSGGLIWIAARKIVVSGTFELSVKGGNGGNGQNAAAPISPVSYPGGGGGGGGGGTIIVIAERAFDWNPSGGYPTLNVSGGTGGTGTPTAVANRSYGGSNGEDGKSYIYILN